MIFRSCFGNSCSSFYTGLNLPVQWNEKKTVQAQTGSFSPGEVTLTIKKGMATESALFFLLRICEFCFFSSLPPWRWETISLLELLKLSAVIGEKSVE